MTRLHRILGGIVFVSLIVWSFSIFQQATFSDQYPREIRAVQVKVLERLDSIETHLEKHNSVQLSRIEGKLDLLVTRLTATQSNSQPYLGSAP